MDRGIAALRESADNVIYNLRDGFVGDDIKDIGALELYGLPVVLNNPDPSAPAAAKFVTQSAGGSGAVRELSSQLQAARQET
jgi:3-deoxy-D-manno-octulosonate 8-phosphate phosphatase KdsC-like HAD superfamily phosphatase